MTDRPALPLYGHQKAQGAFLKARAGHRLHHAWIVEGPSGIGKSRFVLRLAGMLLGAQGTEDDPAAAPPEDPVMQKILADAHPDLKHVTRQLNDKGNLKQDISVDQIRDLNSFFSLKPALGGWRIGILDSLDEMNTNGLNAVLKTLEEPPAQAIIFLISHATAPVLPTIKSRCQTLRLDPLSREDTARALAENDDEVAPGLVDLVNGRPGRAAELTGPKVLAAANAAQTLLRSLPRPNEAQLSNAIAAASEDDQSFRVFSEEVLRWLADRANDDAQWASTWFEAQQIVTTQKGLHMTGAQAASKLVSCLQSTAKAR
ncbi:DNA polymerase III subunit delta' [Henriciella litoralis]|uniref:DNA polymerase III subunit delta' n=1 Tax=Henriciella litoralis TaxID=568102 RepID=UPI000A00EAE3|nr:DNA polymerase III subunit delta' [Henriciella litoralis]